MRVIVWCFAVLLATAAAAQEASPAQTQGHADRQGFEQWIQSLPPDQRRGADFWAQERSKPRPQPCAARGKAEPPEFTAGCNDARSRLAGFDVRRKTEADYRVGWNMPLDQQGAASPPSDDRVTAPSRGTWYLASQNLHECLPLDQNFLGIKTPQELMADMRRKGIFAFMNNEGGKAMIYYEIDNKHITIALFENEAACRAAMRTIEGQTHPESADEAPAVKGKIIPAVMQTPLAGFQVAELKVVYKDHIDCGGSFCDFDSEELAEKACPGIPTCTKLELVVKDGRIRGYTADFLFAAWKMALEESTKYYGSPKKSFVVPSDILRMRNDYESWKIGDLTLTFTYTSGYDGQDRPLDIHSITISPEYPKSP